MQGRKELHLDYLLTGIVFTLICFGIVMVASSSVALADRYNTSIFHFAVNQSIYALLGILCMWFSSSIPTHIIKKFATPLFIISLVGLVIVLLPGVSRPINGSHRWIQVAGFTFQPSELTKLACVIYLSAFFSKYREEIATNNFFFFYPVSITAVLAVLLLLEPDFGTTVVLITISLSLLIVAGTAWQRLLLLIFLAVVTLSGLLILSPYRLARLTVFLDPWSEQFNGGYQLVQSLIAFGRGGLWGTGLGLGIQKLLYLPEPHTDFIFAVIAEELGFIGAICLFAFYLLLLTKILATSLLANKNSDFFGCYAAFGIFIWFCAQIFINISVNIGLLPTKGLPLPFVSFGGSNMLVNCLAIGLLLRIHSENRV